MARWVKGKEEEEEHEVWNFLLPSLSEFKEDVLACGGWIGLNEIGLVYMVLVVIVVSNDSSI